MRSIKQLSPRIAFVYAVVLGLIAVPGLVPAKAFADNVPIAESIDGGAYKPVGVDALKAVKEGEIITIRKVEEVILEIQIGVAKRD